MVSAVDDSPIASHTRVLAENYAKLNLAPDILGRSFGRQNTVLRLAGQSADIKNDPNRLLTRDERAEMKAITKRQKGQNKSITKLERALSKAVKKGDKSEIEALRKDRQSFIDDRKRDQDRLKEITETLQNRGKVKAGLLKEEMHSLNTENHASTGFLRGIDPFMGSMAVDYIAETDKTAEDVEAASSYASAGVGGLGSVPGQIGSYLSFGTSRN